MADTSSTSATFILNLEDGVSSSAEGAAQALQKLNDQLTKDQRTALANILHALLAIIENSSE